MAQQVINDGEDGVNVRTKLNEMFLELYNILLGADSSGGASGVGIHWQIVYNPVLDINELIPIDDINVAVPQGLSALTLLINSLFWVDSDGTIHSSQLAAGITTNRMVEVDSAGLLVAAMRGKEAYEDVSGNKTLTVNDFAVYVTTDATILTMTLPDAADHAGKPFLIRKQSGNAGVIIDAVGTDTIVDGSRVAGAKTIASAGEWCLLRAKATGVWQVEASGGAATSSGGSETARGVLEVSANANVSIEYAAYVGGSELANVELTLPEIASVGNVDFTFRCNVAGSALWAFSVLKSGTDIITFVGFTGSTGLTTTTEGAWIKVMSSTVDGNGIWYVIAGGENWEAIV